MNVEAGTTRIDTRTPIFSTTQASTARICTGYWRVYQIAYREFADTTRFKRAGLLMPPKPTLRGTRRRGLYLLRELSRLEPTTLTDIWKLNIEEVLPALDSPAVRLLGMAAFLKLVRERRPDKVILDEYVALLRNGIANNFFDSPVFGVGPLEIICIGRCRELDLINLASGSRFRLSADNTLVKKAVGDGLSVLSEA
jgi:hypothetical protein